MINTLLFIVGGGLLFFAVFSQSLNKTFLTAPMAFMGLGIAVNAYTPEAAETLRTYGGFETFAELTLGLILFSDAASLKITSLRREYPVPMRLLFIALPLTILSGAGVAAILFEDIPIAQALLIAAILAPTDAALGAAVASSQSVPRYLRETVNVESGLNDGLALPAVLFAAALFIGDSETIAGEGGWILFTLTQITLGVAIGLAVGAAGGFIVVHAWKKRWLAEDYQSLCVIGLALIAIGLPPLLGGNAFISAYIAGLSFGAMSHNSRQFVDFAETEGNFFSLMIFFIFGAVLAPQAILAALPDQQGVIDWRLIAYAGLSLTIIRIVPTMIALIGTKLSAPDRLFLGWFGPRGLASILFLVIAMDEHPTMHAPLVETVVYLTVFASVILHGASAQPLSALFAFSTRRRMNQSHKAARRIKRSRSLP